MIKGKLWFISGILALLSLFYLLKPKTTPNSSLPRPSTESTTSAQPSTNAKTFDLVVKDKKLVSGPDTLTVIEGDQVTINITSDNKEEFHLHGYDKSVDLEANK